jgi:two-component system, NtrC family, sensor histidine kinase HydH
VQREAARLNDLVSDMLDLSRPRAPGLGGQRHDLTHHCRHVDGSNFGRAGTDVEVTYAGPSRAVVAADEAQFRQLVWNLVRNAVQASRAGEAVEVRLDASAEHLWLNVVDHGIGIDEAARAKIFDAFFTTRSQGTGVGLAVVKRIADAHGFSIQVLDNPDGGVTFRVDLGEPRQVEPVAG